MDKKTPSVGALVELRRTQLSRDFDAVFRQQQDRRGALRIFGAGAASIGTLALTSCGGGGDDDVVGSSNATSPVRSQAPGDNVSFSIGLNSTDQVQTGFFENRLSLTATSPIPPTNNWNLISAATHDPHIALMQSVSVGRGMAAMGLSGNFVPTDIRLHVNQLESMASNTPCTIYAVAQTHVLGEETYLRASASAVWRAGRPTRGQALGTIVFGGEAGYKTSSNLAATFSDPDVTANGFMIESDGGFNYVPIAGARNNDGRRPYLSVTAVEGAADVARTVFSVGGNEDDTIVAPVYDTRLPRGGAGIASDNWSLVTASPGEDVVTLIQPPALAPLAGTRVPPGRSLVAVDDVRLSILQISAHATAVPCNIYAVGEAHTQGQESYVEAAAGRPWAQAGVTRGALLGTIELGGPVGRKFSSNLQALVSNANAAANGLLIVSNGGREWVQLNTNEASNTQRPKLVVTISHTSAAPSPAPAPTPAPAPPPPPPAPTPSPPPLPNGFTRPDDASRLLTQTTFGATRAQVDRAFSMGLDAWLDEQFAMPRSTSHVQWMRDQGYETEPFLFNRAPLDYTIWRKYVTAPDQLRQRVVHALSQIFVVAVEGVPEQFPHFAVGRFLDILDEHAFGSYRRLLEDVTLSTAMGRYLSMLGSRRADSTGRRPDENYAREVMQLFSIGLVELERDGRPRLVNGATVPTYDEADVTGLARAFTGWELQIAGSNVAATRALGSMTNIAGRHETGVKSFLDVTIPANTSGPESLRIALDTLAAHPNVGPFIAKQLIQRLVTSNPSPAYVGRVAAAFNANAMGVRGDLGATVRAVLRDPEARTASVGPTAVSVGKVREPVLRFLQWARAAGLNSPSGIWRIGSLVDPATRLGQSPMHSPSVFNFYRPGYVPPNTALATRGLVAPEFQITTETSVAGYLNFMQGVISNTTGIVGSDAVADYAEWLPLAGNPAALVAQANLVIAAGRLSPATVSTITTAVQAMASNTPLTLARRVHATFLLTMASPDYLVEQ